MVLMSQANINDFMNRFHALEQRHDLFGKMIADTPLWDTVRYEACCFLFSCVSATPYLSEEFRSARRSRLGAVRRATYREMLLARARVHRRPILALRCPRIATATGLRDAALDPLIDLFPPAATLRINTLPRRYHVPSSFSAKPLPPFTQAALREVAIALAAEFALTAEQLARLEGIMQHSRRVFETDVIGYHRLLATARPAAILLVQNGMEKALFHVANERRIPTIEAQHGLVGFGHAGYSYAPGINYNQLTTVPDLFLTFSRFWNESNHYPARKHAAVGTDHFGSGMKPVHHDLGAILVVSADIYHDKLFTTTRALAQEMPNRMVIYKLHPNQCADEPSIRDAFSDLPNVVIGDPAAPATRMMDDVSHVIAIQSTMVYEALQHGRKICIVPSHDYHIHADIFGHPMVSVCDDQSKLIEALERPSGRMILPVFFSPFDATEAKELISAMLPDSARRQVAAL
jgi:hypothetical protein